MLVCIQFYCPHNSYIPTHTGRYDSWEQFLQSPPESLKVLKCWCVFRSIVPTKHIYQHTHKGNNGSLPRLLSFGYFFLDFSSQSCLKTTSIAENSFGRSRDLGRVGGAWPSCDGECLDWLIEKKRKKKHPWLKTLSRCPRKTSRRNTVRNKTTKLSLEPEVCVF